MKEYDGGAFETMHCRMFAQSLFLVGNNKSEPFLRRNPFYRHNQLGQQPGKYFYLGIEKMFNKMFENFDFNSGWSLFKTYQLFSKDFGWRFFVSIHQLYKIMKIKKQNLTKAYFFVIFRQVCRFSVQWTPQHYIVYEACLNSNDIPKLLFDIVHR